MRMTAPTILLAVLAQAAVAARPVDMPLNGATTDMMLHDVAGEICRHKELAGATVQVPKEEFRPVYLSRLNLIFASPGMIPALKSKYGTLQEGGVGLGMYLKPVTDPAWEQKLHDDVAAALAQEEGCEARLIGAFLAHYRAKAQMLPKVYH